MCAVVGFFTGCALAAICEERDSSCPKHGRQSARLFSNWNDRATVRSAPRRLIHDEDVSLDMFPRHLVPVVSHDIIRSRFSHIVHDFLCLQLYRYLEFTINLELTVVSEVTRSMIMQEAPVSLPPSMILDAQRILCDEAYHAVFCGDMLQQVITATGVSAR